MIIDQRLPTVLRVVLCTLVLLLLATSCSRSEMTDPETLEASELAAIAGVVEASLGVSTSTQPADAMLRLADFQAYAALWSGGRSLARAWGGSLDEALEAASSAVEDGPAQVEFVEISLAHGFRTLDLESLGSDLTSIHRGVRGLQVAHGDRILRFAPSDMVASNLSFERALSRAARTLELDGQTLIQEAQVATFEAAQVVVDTGEEPALARQLLRGNRLVSMDQVSREGVADLGLGMQHWMLNNLHRDGRMTYMYYPTSGKESDSNNMIRQWMASLCLTRMGLATGDASVLEAAQSNIRYNLAQFYRVEGELGLIEYDGKVKLGAVALAALAILEHPEREQFAEPLTRLIATTDHLWRDDGAFQTFYRPASRSADPNLHNFSPGETLLLWASLLKEAPDADRQRRFMQSFNYYRDWHLANRKPSFIPWHTQAYYLEWQRTGDPRLRDWIFEMNDWLLDMQVYSRQAYDDTEGRFYDPRPENRHFGPPHASSTGVYLEGLIDAYQLAMAEGDDHRAAAYARSMELGLRSAMQLQFRDDETGWFVRDRARTVGGLRTTVYNNVIRVDNVQHTLMAVMKIQDHLARAGESPLLSGDPAGR